VRRLRIGEGKKKKEEEEEETTGRKYNGLPITLNSTRDFQRAINEGSTPIGASLLNN